MKTQKTANPLFDASLKTSIFLVKLLRVASTDVFHATYQAQEQLMDLTIREEQELVHWITILTQRGYAPRYRTIRELAEIIRHRRVLGIHDDDIQLVTYHAFGQDWVNRFMQRYPQLISARMKLIDAARIKDVSVERLTKWFEDLQSVINEYKIEAGNLDESGFAIGDG